ncbi:MAG: cytochrome-c peroxidase [Chitinophagaceae bacterium]|jgi:cytochrome c peroxidase|nr:cytochrome-c peroxidase [Chitinophagaceae bacterium]MBK7678580.1 cytochrome-c peroxidase [Chitinophagaceae bacterium]MBK8300074.1 cytochrome-c peroxidase [Chitinophagaceae bacterium]MBK9464117.1 cytochrome-c peroxidase [Chitinophagaceae bacterium]MBK9658762.1 cytochrome-c peroxidase [Chitinophagaceae bacterium]
MRKLIVITLLSVIVLFSVSFTKENLRNIYSRPSSAWPKPFIDEGVIWQELGVLPPGPLEKQMDSLKAVIELGKALFFDTRLSGSGKISCATCHQPELNWTDGKVKSIGHEGAVTQRNSPTIQNSWYYNRLFWDGRSRDLQDQAFGPINSETEMHSEMPEVMRKLRRVKGYKELFKKAFGDEEIDPFVMTEAIATFEKTISSRKSRFDEFLEGNKKALNNSEVRGLHLFRTKARCINCHNGPLFSDNQFHNRGFSNGDVGYYKVTHIEEDMGKFKTPSLRDVARTGPWMHDGQFNSLEQIISQYSIAKFPPGTNPLLRTIGLTDREQKDLLAFLKAISAPPLAFSKPVLPE